MSISFAIRTIRRGWPQGVHGVAIAVLAISLTVLQVLGAPALPRAEEILDKATEAEGGRAAHEALHTRVLHGTMIISGIGVKAALVEYAARPNKTYTLISGEAIGKIESGTDGAVAWDNSTLAGPKVKEGLERAAAMREAAFDGLVNWRELYTKAECLGIDSLQGKPCYRVVLSPAEGAPDTSYFAKESGLLVLTRTSMESDLGNISVAAYAEDYRKVDGILMPFRMRQVAMGGLQEMTVVVDSVRHNVALGDDRFAPPAEVTALIEKQKADASKSNAPGKSVEKPVEIGK